MDAVAAVIAHHESESDRFHARLLGTRALREQLTTGEPEQRGVLRQSRHRRMGGGLGMTDRARLSHVLDEDDRDPRWGGYRLGAKGAHHQCPGCRIFLVYAADGRITAFVIERAFRGLSGTPTHKMGMRASTMGDRDGRLLVNEKSSLGGEGQA